MTARPGEEVGQDGGRSAAGAGLDDTRSAAGAGLGDARVAQLAGGRTVGSWFQRWAAAWSRLPSVRRVRILTTLFFGYDGVLFAEWVVRVPQIKAQVGASPGMLGLALLGSSAGAVLTMKATGWLCNRFGSRRISVLTAALLAASVVLPPQMNNALGLGGVLLIFGAAYGGVNVAVNSVAVDVVDELDRPVMPSFHAAYSCGGLAGAVTGGVIAEFLSPAWHLALVGLVGLLVTAVLGTLLVRCPAFPAEQRNAASAQVKRVAAQQRRSARRARAQNVRTQSVAVDDAADADDVDDVASAVAERAAQSARGEDMAPGEDVARGAISAPAANSVRGAGARVATSNASVPADHDRAHHEARRLRMLVYVFGCIALCSAFGEGALADWGALHLRQDLHTSVGLAAAGYASFSVAMLIGRLSGAWVLARVGRTAVLAGGGATAAAGMLVAALVPQLPLALLGFVLVGLGLANLFPAAIGQAGALTGPPGVATASTFGYGGMLVGPPLIGFLADRFGLPIALTSISVLAGAAAVIAVAAARQEAAQQQPSVG